MRMKDKLIMHHLNKGQINTFVFDKKKTGYKTFFFK